MSDMALGFVIMFAILCIGLGAGYGVGVWHGFKEGRKDR
jgi:hypothetical protein